MRRPALCVLLIPALMAADPTPFTAPARPPEFQDVHSSSLYLSMSDGVRIAVDVVLPKELPPGRKIPALLKISRFGRAPLDGSTAAEDRFWTGHGYARILIDERGTGASFGTSRYGPGEIGDLREIVDWIVKQPWSSGRVGAIGTSVEGTAAELLAATGHPAVRAVAPWFSDYNYYTDLIRPGGVYNRWLLEKFQGFTAQMDAGASAKRVAADADGSLLQAAVAEHRKNIDIHAATRAADFIDDRLAGGEGSLQDLSIPAARTALRRSRVPMLILASWFDAGTAQGALQRFRDFPNVQRIVIGAWSHGGSFDANPFSPAPAPAEPARQQQWLEALRFFDQHLKDVAGARDSERRIEYYTIGENEWHTTAAWPPARQHRVAFHLQPGGKLAAGGSGEPTTVTLKPLSSGDRNRWHTQLGGQAVDYAEALPKMQAAAVTFTSDPLRAPLPITGQPILHLRLTSSRPDASVLAYLVAVSPGGRPSYLTEGHLRLTHRKLEVSQQTLHTFKRRDAEPVPPGEPIRADLSLLPISVVVPRGASLQLLLASDDTSTFAAGGEVAMSVLRASTIELPAMASSGPMNLTTAEWREDLRVFAREMPRRHANVFHFMSRERFASEVESLDRRLEDLDDDEIYVAMTRIANLIGDAHTFLAFPPDVARFPIALGRFGDDFRVVAAAPGLESALGTRLVRIDSTPISAVCDRISGMTAADENPPLRRALITRYLTLGIVLHGFGITTDRNRARGTFVDDEGHETTIALHAAPAGAAPTQLVTQPPLYRQNPQLSFWTRHLPEARTLYCGFRGYQDLRTGAKALFREIRSQPPDKLVIDMRQNGGGDYTKGLRHLISPIRELADINRKGHLFVLVGPLTFSAAMANAAHFRSQTNAILVGETIGEKPNSYAEPRQMSLPNSKLVMRYSTRFYTFVESGENVIRPDHEVIPKWDDYKEGRDPVLDWVLRYRTDTAGN